MNTATWDMDNLLIKLNDLERQNYELSNEIRTLLRMSNEEFSMVDDILKIVISKCQADPIIKMRENITKESIIAESLEKVQEKNIKSAENLESIDKNNQTVEVRDVNNEVGIEAKTEAAKALKDIVSKLQSEPIQADATLNGLYPDDKVQETTENNISGGISETENTETKTGIALVLKTPEERYDEYIENLENPLIKSKLKTLMIDFNNIKSTGAAYNDIFTSSELSLEEKEIVNRFWMMSFYRLFMKPSCGSIENQRVYCELFEMFRSESVNVDSMKLNFTYNIMITLGTLKSSDLAKKILAQKYKQYKYTACIDKMIRIYTDYDETKANLLRYKNTKDLNDQQVRDLCIKALAHKSSNYKNCASEENVRNYLDKHKVW